MKKACIVIAHGSRDPQATEAFFEFLKKFRRVSLRQRFVEGAFLELAKPSIPEAIETCVARGAGDIVVLPMMFFPGRHVKEDIPRLIEKAKAAHPEVEFHYAAPVSENPKLAALMAENVAKVKGRS